MAKENVDYQELLNIVRSMKNSDELYYFFLRACENGSLNVCQICLDAGADINMRESKYKHTLLNGLTENNKLTPEVADWMIKNGADINLVGYGQSNLSWACINDNYDIAKYFIDKGIKFTKYDSNLGLVGDLYWAVDGKNYNIVKLLLESGVEFETDVICDSNPFMNAVENKLYEIAELFLQNGLSPDFYAYDFYHYCVAPIHIATKMKDIQMTSILLKYNANVNAKIKNNNEWFIEDTTLLTPMDIAVFNQDVEMQKLLESFGGIVSSKQEKIQSIQKNCDEDDKKALLLKKLLES